jgi:hypothetical protein
VARPSFLAGRLREEPAIIDVTVILKKQEKNKEDSKTKGEGADRVYIEEMGMPGKGDSSLLNYTTPHAVPDHLADRPNRESPVRKFEGIDQLGNRINIKKS